MARTPTLKIVALVLCTMATPCLAQGVDVEDGAHTGEIRGNLGVHWGLATVRLSRPDGREGTAEADGTGRFSFRGLEPGVYWVLLDGLEPRRVELTNHPGPVAVTDYYLPRTSVTPTDTLTTLGDRVKHGRSVTVTLDTGEEVLGRLDSVSTTQLTVRRGRTTRIIDEASIWRIESRKPTCLWKGTAVGAALGALGVYAVFRIDDAYEGAAAPWSTYRRALGMATGIGAVIGFSVASRETGHFGTRELLFQRTRKTTLTPIVSRRAVGAAVSLGWN